MEALLRESGISPHIEIHRTQGRGAEAPTWADDVVVLFTASGPQEVEPILVSLGTQVVARLRSLGLAANLGAGKTEAIVSIKGHGSRSVRRHLLAKDDPCVTLPSQQATPVSLRVVPSYVHLGTSINAELSETPNLKRRAQLLYAAFKPVKNKLLCNPFLLFHEKREVIMSRIIPCFLHGSGLWRLVTRHEVDAALGPLNSVFRQCIRPLTGHCAKLLTQEEVLATLDLPSVEEQIRVNQVRALAYVLQDDMRASWQGFLSDGHWLRQACEAAKLVFPSAALQTLLPDGAPATLSALAGHFSGQGRALRKACRRYLRSCRARRPPVDWAAVALRQEQADAVEIVACHDPRLTHVCQECGASFLSLRRLSVHLSKRHHQHARGRRVAHGTCCEVCSVQFWTTARLAAHLNRSATCQSVYDGSDIAPEAFVETHAPAWKPCATTFGPKPFWATLRP